MADISSFGAEDIDLIASLPFRVGVWIADADDMGGEDDDRRETRALEKAISVVARRHESSAFVQEIVKETLKRRDRWDEWTANALHVPDDCVKALDILRPQLPKADFDSFRKTLYQIALNVSEAYGEFAEDGENENLSFMGRIRNFFTETLRSENESFVNISPAEQAALDELKTALSRKKPE